MPAEPDRDSISAAETRVGAAVEKRAPLYRRPRVIIASIIVLPLLFGLAALFTAHRHLTGSSADALTRTVSSVYDLLANTLDSGDRELALVESQDAFAHPRGQFEVTRVR